jgi:Glycosyl transferase family 2
MSIETISSQLSWRAELEGTTAAERALAQGSSRKFFLAMANSPFAERDPAARQRAIELAVSASTPLVSVVMPVVGEFDLAGRAIQSVSLQSYSNLEMIVVIDKAATEIERLNRTAADDTRIKLVFDDGRGSGAARNLGIDLARGEYIAFLDHDDWFMPTKIARQSAAMIEQGSLISHTSYLVVYPSRHLGPTQMHSGRNSGRLFPALMSNCPIAAPTVMIHRTIPAAGFRFPETEHLGADVILWTEIASNYPVLGIDDPLSVVEWSDESAAINLEKQAIALKLIHDSYATHPIFSLYPDQLAKIQNAMVGIEAQRQNRLAKEATSVSDLAAPLFDMPKDLWATREC